MIAARAPAAAWLKPEYTEMRPGLCRLRLPASRELRRGDEQIDPAALCALSQLAAILIGELSIPKTIGWQLRGLTIEYLRSTSEAVEALTRLDRKDWRDLKTIALPVTITDAQGVEVARAVVSLALSGPGTESTSA